MPSKQARKQTSTPGAGAARRPGQSSPPAGSPRKPQARTAEPDPSFNLISVLYHALQGAETAARYQQDAETAGSDELVEFFEQTRMEYAARAADAKRLLTKMLGVRGSEEDETEEEEEDEDEDEDEDKDEDED
jgi:hypothetical protein